MFHDKMSAKSCAMFHARHNFMIWEQAFKVCAGKVTDKKELALAKIDPQVLNSLDRLLYTNYHEANLEEIFRVLRKSKLFDRQLNTF